MSIELKSIGATVPSTEATVYTVPTGKSATLISAIHSNPTALGLNTATAVLSWRRSGVATTISNISGLAPGSSSNPLSVGKVILQAGDEVRSSAGTALSPFGGSVSVGIATHRMVFTNAAKTALFAACATGIARSTDGVTWTTVLSVAFSAAYPVYAQGSNIYIYTSTTTAIRSTDNGLTWTVGVAVTNGPSVTLFYGGENGIIYNGSTAVGMASTTQLVSSTDGVTWSNLGVALPSTCTSLCWTGSRYVLGRNGTASDIYHSTDGAAWTTVSAVGGGTSVNSHGLASDGAGVVIAQVIGGSTPGTYRSTDHGVSWTWVSAAVSATAEVIYRDGLFVQAASASVYTSSVANSGSGPWTAAGTTQSSFSFASWTTFNSKQWGVWSNILRASADLALTPTYGLSLTLSVMENT